ncbi:glutathione peroxidase [Breznakibacter xylanolyticus]|uniref:Glutathione peroxidase n=1 Tax=Breznakibacter xylanolyticus TaxID=990 RepID=A0A2W7NTN5_9BACT|nr:glutathione peroxidase [Breznakibacter xylanolyticus]PZX16696.1 glutathione peroxidase [Breznakibacter xylanolyticus]
MSNNIYQFSAKTLQGKEISMDNYKGKVVIVVNTASKCGFTPQYADLNTLYNKYKEYGLVILGFPCNQFGNQEPGGAKEISEGCLLNYGVSFQMFDKVDVNGSSAHPLFKHIKKELPGILGGRIVWNFTKFIFDRQGKPVKRYAPITSPLKMENQIRKLLGL